MLTIPIRIEHTSQNMGMDSIELCRDKDHFRRYSKKISYKYNSKGFRDDEWPSDLSNVVWCLGDSFTVGIGQPVDETWPKLLEKKIKKQVINLGEDGCSNDTLSLRAQEIVRLHNPKLLIIMWSYLHRRRVEGENVHYNEKSVGLHADLSNLKKNMNLCDHLPVNIIHLIIPHAMIGEDAAKRINTDIEQDKLFNADPILKKITSFPQLDHARDYFHFDLQTAEFVTNLIVEKINKL